MAPTVGFHRVGLPGGGLFFAAVPGECVADDFVVCGGVYRLVMVLQNRTALTRIRGLISIKAVHYYHTLARTLLPFGFPSDPESESQRHSSSQPAKLPLPPPDIPPYPLDPSHLFSSIQYQHASYTE